MTDRQRLDQLISRLHTLEHTSVAPWHRSVHAVAMRALEAEIADLGRRLACRSAAGERSGNLSDEA